MVSPTIYLRTCGTLITREGLGEEVLRRSTKRCRIDEDVCQNGSLILPSIAASPSPMNDPHVKADAAAPKISFVSLGCPKALVDSERIVTRLRAEGYELSRQHQGSDLVIVNTCGFLDSAQGGIACSHRQCAEGERQGHRYRAAWVRSRKAFRPPIPTFWRSPARSNTRSVVEAVHRALPPKHDPFLDLVPPEGIKLTPRHYAYLKISEGCNNRCSFCIIPRLRGDLVSRSAADVLREAEKLVAAGVKELLVISQDTSAYGVDLKYAVSKWRDRDVRAKFIDLAWCFR